MPILKYASLTALLLLPVDLLWIRFVIGPVFQSKIPHLLGDGFDIPMAVAAYLVMVISITGLVLVPHGGKGSMTVFTYGALLGFALYGVFEFTNAAILRAWDWTLIPLDILWGTLICGVISVSVAALVKA